jgi:aminopeptidase
VSLSIHCLLSVQRGEVNSLPTAGFQQKLAWQKGRIVSIVTGCCWFLSKSTRTIQTIWTFPTQAKGIDMNEVILEKYADLILKAGINFKEGQNLLISAEPIHWDFVNLLEKRAYENGARYIYSDILSPISKKNRVNYQKEEYLEYLPSYFEKKMNSFIEEEWSFIRLDGQENPNVFLDLNQKKHTTLLKSVGIATKPLVNARMSGKCPWCIAGFPTPNWASLVMESPASENTTRQFWEILVSVLRLDNDNPIDAWEKHNETLKNRCKFLNDRNLDYLHFEGPDTDLKVYTIPNSIWMGGALTSPEGKEFFPNLPTEEVFTTPDFRKTEGKAKVTRSVKVMGDQVKDAWFEFKDGKVINYGASEGKDTLDKYLQIDPNASYLGEVALVDTNSPIFQSGKTFHSILFDENAACRPKLPMALLYFVIIWGFGIMIDDDSRPAILNVLLGAIHVTVRIASFSERDEMGTYLLSP